MGIAWASVSSSTRSMNSRMSALPSYWIFHPCKVVIIAPQDSAGDPASLGGPDAMVVGPLSMFLEESCISGSWGSRFR